MSIYILSHSSSSQKLNFVFVYVFPIASSILNENLLRTMKFLLYVNKAHNICDSIGLPATCT